VVLIVLLCCVPHVLHPFTFLSFPTWNIGPTFGVSVITHTIRHTVVFLWTSDQPVAETAEAAGQHNRQISMTRAGFEPATPETKRPQTYALDCAATTHIINIIQVKLTAGTHVHFLFLQGWRFEEIQFDSFAETCLLSWPQWTPQMQTIKMWQWQ
jgi:hypothetical protein